MAFDRFMIAPLTEGLQNNVKPWLVPDNAFVELNNAYVFRGRVRKRFGTRLMNYTGMPAQLNSRLRINVGTTNMAGSLSGTVPGVIFQVGQSFSIGQEMFTVVTAGNQAMLDTGNTTTATFNTANGNFVFVGSQANTIVWFYPSQPVMGFFNYEVPMTNNEFIIAFDTQFAYQRNSGGWTRLAGGTSIWEGTDSEFFWAENFSGDDPSKNFLYVTNFDATDPNFMRYYDGTNWNVFNPAFSAVNGNTVITARLIVAFKGTLLLLNTVENNSVLGNGLSYRNRMRFSDFGDAVSTTAFYQDPDPAGFGGVLDNLGTQEAIVSAEFIKDRLIVFFERSTWEIVYTGNNIAPFRWQKINTELGVESTFSVIPFDRVALGFGDVGIHACNGTNVERIDNKIPDEVFYINRIAQGVERVYGIRDYYTELAYWTFPDTSGLLTYPNRVLVFNYKTQSWAFIDDTMTCFGYYYNEDSTNNIWQDITSTWEETTRTWNSGVATVGFRNIICGNQQGYTFIIQSGENNAGRNAPVLQITNITIVGPAQATIVCINHNLLANSFVCIENVQGMVGINNTVFTVGVENSNTFTIYANPNTPVVPITGIYTGGGTVTTISIVDINTKQYNFYLDKGRNVSVSKVDFFIDNEGAPVETDPPTAPPQVTVSYYISSSEEIIQTQILELSPYATYPVEATQDRLWHPLYPMINGEFIQLRIYYSDDQMFDLDIAWEDFVLHAMTFYAQPTSDRLQ